MRGHSKAPSKARRVSSRKAATAKANKPTRARVGTKADKPTRARVSQAGTAAKKLLVIAAFGEVGTVFAAVKRVGVSRSRHYEWIADDPAYAKQFSDAVADRADILVAEATRRAVEGTKKPVFWQGVVVGAVREYSDTLLLALLKAALPEKFRERYDINYNKYKDDELLAKARAAGIVINADGGLSVPDLEAKPN